ncbi:MAG TPA: NAD-dependent epimerase/dehydratase family protein [Solirubrobacterales bacterium]|nr:NAD-dependent epimerase/dehydratase family protein [Solirubrobacterales bacterium]
MSDGVEVVAERMDRRRVLITGLSSYWGGRLAQALESFAEIEAIVGVDTKDPTRELERTEFVKVSNQHGLIQRIVRAARIDTVIDARLVVDSITTSRQRAHESNVIGTMNLLAACAGESSPVRKFIFKSSGHVYGSAQTDPAFFTEAMTRSQPAASPIERDVAEAEASVIDFANKQRNVDVTVLRCANVLGPDVNTSFARMFGLPLVPMIAGFDPRLQFTHEDDIVHALEHAAVHRLPGVFNVAADGVLAQSEIIGLLGKRPLPILPPWGTGLLAGPLRALGVQVPPEMLNMLRFGRGLDNRRYKASGFEYGYTTRESVLAFSEHLRLQPILRGVESTYTYEGEVERFLRRSPLARPPQPPESEASGTEREPFGI